MFEKIVNWFKSDKKHDLEKHEEDRFVSEGGPDPHEARMQAAREAEFVKKEKRAKAHKPASTRRTNKARKPLKARKAGKSTKPAKTHKRAA